MFVAIKREPVLFGSILHSVWISLFFMTIIGQRIVLVTLVWFQALDLSWYCVKVSVMDKY